MSTGLSVQSGYASHRSAVAGNMLGTLSMILWAAGFPASELLLANWDPLVLITARLALAVMFLLVVWVALEGPQALIRAKWGAGALIGAVGFGGGAYLILLGQSLSDPVTVAVIASAAPVIGALLEIMFDGRRLRIWFVAGLAVCIYGGLLATGSIGGDVALGWGAGFALISVVLFSWGSRATVLGIKNTSLIGRTTITMAGALIGTGMVCVPMVLLGHVEMPHDPVDAQQILMLSLYAIGAMALSQLLWIASVGRLGVAVASFHMNVAPFYVMLFMIALGAAWNWEKAAGAAVVLTGVLLAQYRPKRQSGGAPAAQV